MDHGPDGHPICVLTKNFQKRRLLANISTTVRARAKILVEINPLGHIHTPPHLFPAKNVIISKICHDGPKIGSFFNEIRFKKCWCLPLHIGIFFTILVNFQPFFRPKWVVSKFFRIAHDTLLTFLDYHVLEVGQYLISFRRR